MKAGVRQLLGLAVAIVSFVGTIIICALPKWRVTKIQGLSYGFHAFSEGLWKVCAISNMHVTQCVTYESQNAPVSQDLEVARALIIIAIIVGVIGILLGVAGNKFVNFVPDERKKSNMAMASGVVFLIAGFFVLIPVCWTTNTINDYVDNQRAPGSPGSPGSPDSPGSPKRELGASVYIGRITTGLWFMGGGLLCSSFLRRDETD